MDNYMKTEFLSKTTNEGFARVVAAAFVSQLDPTLEQIQDIKTAVSEAVTNAIIHGYENAQGLVSMTCEIVGRTVTITIADFGGGIADIEQARMPLYTSKPEMERSGMGFTVMESFMDNVIVYSQEGRGTKVIMTKSL